MPVKKNAKSESSPNALIHDAEGFFVKGKLSAGLRLIDQALSINATNARALVIKARILTHLDRLREAVRHLHLAIRNDRNCAEAYLERARISYAIRKQNKSALGDIAKTLALARRDRWIKVEAFRIQGDIFNELDRDEEAIASYKNALRLKPDDAEIRWALGESHSLVGQARKALRQYDRALQILLAEKTLDQLTLGFVIAGKARVLNGMGNQTEALRVIETGLKRVRNSMCRKELRQLYYKTRSLMRTERQRH